MLFFMQYKRSALDPSLRQLDPIITLLLNFVIKHYTMKAYEGVEV
jgi:hypothetical protein